MWTSSVERNDLMFSNNKWDSKRTQHLIRQSLLEYARNAWVEESCLETSMPLMLA